MRAREFILEAEVSDDELRARWGNLGPNIRNVVPRSATNLDPAPTLWQVWEVIEDILGKENVYISWPEYDDDDEDPEEIDSKMFYVFQKDKYFMYRPTKSSSPGGSIEVPNLYSTSAKDIAIAAHEAYHAYIDANHQDG